MKWRPIHLRHSNLMVRLASYFLLLSLATTTLVGTIAYHQARETLTQLIFDHLQGTAALKEEDLRRWLADQRQEFTFIAQLPEMQRLAGPLLQMEAEEADPTTTAYEATYGELSQLLHLVQGNKTGFEEIFILTAVGGKIAISTNKNHEGEYRVLDSYYTQGRLGTFVQNVYPSPVTGKPTLTISTPLLSQTGDVLGVLAVHMNLEEMDAIILERSGLGLTGETYLVDQYNVFVSGKRFGRQEFPRGVHTEGIDAALNKETGTGLYLNYEGIPVIGAYHWIDELDLAMLAEIDEAEAFAPAQRLALTILLSGLSAAVLLAIGVYILARRITHPVLAIARVASQVAGGDLTATVPVYGDDEIGLLGRAFNQMTRQLRLLYAGLEQKVSELQHAETALQQYARRLEIQHETDRAILEAQLPEEIADAALSHLRFLVPYEAANVTIFDFEAQEAIVLTADKSSGTYLEAGTRLSLANFGRISDLHQGRSFRSGDARYTADSPVAPQGQEMRSYMSVPLLWRDELIGSLNLGAVASQIFTDEHLEIAHEVANQLAVAIRQAQLFAATQRQLKELTVLHAVTTTGTEVVSEDELIRRATKVIGDALYPDRFGIGLVNEAAGLIEAHNSYRGVTPAEWPLAIPVGQGITGQVALDGQPRCIADVSLDPHYVAVDPDTRSELCVPLRVGDRTIGVINIESTQLDAFTQADERLLMTLAGQLATAIEKVRLFEKARAEIRERRRAEQALRQARDELEARVTERTAELTMLNRASQALISTLDLDQVLITVLEELRNLLAIDACSAWLIDSMTGELVCRQCSGPATEALIGARLPAGGGIVGWAVQRRTSLLLADATADERHTVVQGEIDLLPRSLLTVPLIVQGRAIGALQALDSEIGRFNQSDLALMESLAATAAFAIENARLYKQARQDAGTKSILLREVNHRVKNNLSAIIGLLYAERRHAGVKDHAIYQTIMEDLINRVQGLATVHSVLSASQWAPVLLSELATRVIYSSLRALPATKRMAVTVTPSPIYVTSDQASNLALIINELTTNSIKYAMAQRPSGQLSVRVSQEEEHITFEMCDDGPGYPPDVLQAEQPRYNVGFHLIHNIVHGTLSGNLALRNSRGDEDRFVTGAITTICFKAKVETEHEPADRPSMASLNMETNEELHERS